jgi:hypothetical protein
MCSDEVVDAETAVEEAAKCCSRIASVLDDAIAEASELGDRELLERLTTAKAAADRGAELIARLGTLLENEKNGRVTH